MLNRRTIVLGGTAIAALSTCPELSRAQSSHGRFNSLLADFLNEQLDESPELSTTLGLDRGIRANDKAKLDDRSLNGLRAGKARIASQLERLRQFARWGLSSGDEVGLDAISYDLSQRASMGRQFPFGEPGDGIPYVVSQMDGAYSTIPDLLANKQGVRTAADAEAFVARLAKFRTALGQENVRILHDAGHGVTPPNFIVDRACEQLKSFRSTSVADAVFITSLVRKAHDAGLAPKYGDEARSLYEKSILPAADRQLETIATLRQKATDEAGVQGLPNGEAYYAACLKVATTTDLSAGDVNKIGLELARKISAELNGELRKLGLAEGTVPQRIAALYDNRQFIFPDTEKGRTDYIAFLSGRLLDMKQRLPRMFRVVPRTDVVIDRVPSYLEDGSPAAYYEDPSLDGTRPGTFYINLRDTAESPRWLMETVAFHETIPGHHLQQAFVQERTQLPVIRKIGWFEGYGEGWALYAEQLADELGLYDHDPWGRIGYLSMGLLRACRLVVDTGLHAFRWSRKQAIAWMLENSGQRAASIQTEVERYCVHPGQACSYMIGKQEWLKLREHARKALGSRFDIRDFHDAGLLCGAVPLVVLNKVIAGYVRSASVGGVNVSP